MPVSDYMKKHTWVRGMRGRTPVLECGNEQEECVIVWRPDRPEPRRPCPVQPEERP